MQLPASPREPSESKIIYLDLGATKGANDAPVPIRIGSTPTRRTQITEILVSFLLLLVVAASLWQCALQSIALSNNHSLQGFVERSVNPDPALTACRKTAVPERS
jgi:hypothetical protein